MSPSFKLFFIYLSGMELPRIILKVSWFKLKEYIYASLVALDDPSQSSRA